MKKSNENGHDFSIELISTKHLTHLSSNGGVLIEGTLGKLQTTSFVEAEIFEVKGDYGVLRLNITKEEIKVSGGQI